MRTKGEIHAGPIQPESQMPRGGEALLDLQRLPLQCYFRAWREGEVPNVQSSFLGTRWLQWAGSYLRNRFGPRYGPYPTWAGSPHAGIHTLRGTDPEGGVLISLASDWGTGTQESAHVGWGIERSRPDYTIHLGDIYYVGTSQAVFQNMLGRSLTGPTVRWPRGRIGSFALNANHEMYARGLGYFEYLLPELGIESESGPTGQTASFFCLKSDDWLVIGLDTGYNSVRRVPLEKVFPPSGKQRDEVLDWLENSVRIQEDRRRGIVLLSHHQYFSAFDRWFPETARQLTRLVERPVLWFWGHEHRLGLYGRTSVNGGIEAWGRCMGHGGMPLEDVANRPDRKKLDAVDLVLYDRRERPGRLDGTPLGFNGFTNLFIQGRRLEVEYRDIELTDGGGIKSCPLLTEGWEVGDAGQLIGTGVRFVPGQVEDAWLHESRSPDDAQSWPAG